MYDFSISKVMTVCISAHVRVFTIFLPISKSIHFSSRFSHDNSLPASQLGIIPRLAIFQSSRQSRFIAAPANRQVLPSTMPSTKLVRTASIESFVNEPTASFQAKQTFKKN